MDKRIRSPNYPAISLPDAIARVTTLYRAIHTHAAPREVVAKGMGYNTLNGASATAISALHKYGLLERSDDDIKISERAFSILHPHTPQEKAEAIRAAAAEPALFAELAERFPGAMPNEDLLRNYLLRKGFAPAATTAVIAAYRDTSEMVDREGVGYDSASTTAAQEPPAMTNLGFSTHQAVQKVLSNQEDGRQIGRYDFEDGGFVKIVASAEIDTEEALNMVETIVELKRREIVRRKQRIATESSGKFDPDEPSNE
jgi:hypothetical protein